MLIYGFSHRMAHHIFSCVTWLIIMDKADKLDLYQSTRRPFKSRELAFSREVNRQDQRNGAIPITISFISLTLPVDPCLFMGFLIAWRIVCSRASPGEL